MNNPKILKMQYRTKRTEESNVINFIDKLPHIMKEDKMLLRRKAKQGDAALLDLLRKRNYQAVKEEDDFKKIEAVVRRYLNDIKSSVKEEQVLRYKQNTLKSYRSSCQKPGNKQNLVVEKKNLMMDTIRFDKGYVKTARSPTSSLQKLHQIKNPRSNKPLYQPQRLDTLKAKYSLEKDKFKNIHTTIQLRSKSKLKPSKLMGGSCSTKNLLKKEVTFQHNLKTETIETPAPCHTDRGVFSPKNENPSYFSEFQKLFTPSDLLKQCKLIIQKSKQITQNSYQPYAPTSPKFNYQPDYFKKPKFEILKNGQTVSFCKQESESNLLDNNPFKKILQEKQQEKLQKIDFETKTAEYIFDCIFTNNFEVTFQTFSETINHIFSSPVQLYRLFQKADVTRTGQITIYEMGKQLQQSRGSEQNYIKDIFQLLDMDRKGYITQSDITNFVHQIIDTSYEKEEVIKDMFMKVLYEADFKNNGKVQYWPLYFNKGLECFKEMVVYISQFEFEVQC